MGALSEPFAGSENIQIGVQFQTNNIVAYNNTDCQEGNIDKNGDSNTNSGYDTAFVTTFFDVSSALSDGCTGSSHVIYISRKKAHISACNTQYGKVGDWFIEICSDYCGELSGDTSHYTANRWENTHNGQSKAWTKG